MTRTVLLLAALCAIACFVEAKRSMRVVNGKEYDIQAAPFMVQFKYWADGQEGKAYKPHIICAGTIADSVHIITAAHCLKDFKDPVKQVAVMAGATERLKGGRTYAIKSVAQHPKFKFGGFMNLKPWNQKYDVAVVTLAEPLEFSDSVQPIPKIIDHRVTNTYLLSGGWGAVVEHPQGTAKDFGEQLKIVQLQFPGDEWCNKLFKRVIISNLANEATDSLICALPIDGTVCGGDSGAPLWINKNQYDPATMVGLVMGSETCEQKKARPAFVDIADPAIREFLSANGIQL